MSHIIRDRVSRCPAIDKEKVSLFATIISSEKIASAKFKTRVVFIDINKKTGSALDNIIGQARFIESLKSN